MSSTRSVRVESVKVGATARPLDAITREPTLDGTLYEPADGSARTALLFMHPTANFLHHYALQPLAERGYAALGANTRYIGNESILLMENVLVDVGRTISLLRQRFQHVVLVGNSGGGSISAYYQSQAQNPTVTGSPGGGGPDLTQAGLSPADALVFLNAHTGRAQALTEWLDPSITNESAPFDRDAGLDMYDERNGPPYAPEWLARFREAQIARNHRITAWVREQFHFIESRPELGINDFAFLVHGTHADPRLLDLTIDPSDRPAGGRRLCISMNLGSTYMGRYTTLHSWLSQWSLATSHANAMEALPGAGVPVMVVQGTADVPVYPSYATALYQAAPEPKKLLWIKGASHYFKREPEGLTEALDAIAGWLETVLS